MFDGVLLCLDFAQSAIDRDLTFEESLCEIQSYNAMFTLDCYVDKYKMVYDEVLSHHDLNQKTSDMSCVRDDVGTRPQGN